MYCDEPQTTDLESSVCEAPSRPINRTVARSNDNVEKYKRIHDAPATLTSSTSIGTEVLWEDCSNFNFHFVFCVGA